MENVVVLTGAGISAESGVKTFRDSGGLWEGHDVMKVASPQGWYENKELVLDFYNQRRRQLHEVIPNAAHTELVKLESKFNVQIITQNVDDLHERAGSSSILHLHGELKKVRSTVDPSLIYSWETDLKLGDKCSKGSQLRPHIVWFGESVPMMEYAAEITTQADIFIIIGTSLQVYPAAGLLEFTSLNTPVYYIDPMPKASYELRKRNVEIIPLNASQGVQDLVNRLLQKKI